VILKWERKASLPASVIGYGGCSRRLWDEMHLVITKRDISRSSGT